MPAPAVLAAPAADYHRPARRAADPTIVHITDATGSVFGGSVLSRSPWGLRLRVGWYMPEGTEILVQAADAAVPAPPVAATVLKCRPMGVLYEVGCQFAKRPPASTLLTFA
ncbi:MAG TPA: hypothetical protein VGF55_10950 [Gemmataceae bacterium]